MRRLAAVLFALVLVALSLTCAREEARCGEATPVPAGTAPVTGHHPHGIDIIDSHVHILPTMPALAQALEVFDRVGITKFVAKSAGVYGEPRYYATVAMKRVLGPRFEYFVNIDWDPIDRPDFATKVAGELERAAREGAKGVKIFKDLGLKVRTADGRIVPVDDPRLDPIFETCARLGFIVAIHVADPVAFFEAVTPANERYEELSIAKGWSFHGKDFPSFEELMAQQERLIARHPNTIFLLIHLGNNAENPKYVAGLFDKYKNVWVDTSARVPEFGRHPAEEMRAFFTKYQDRILFGSDFISSPNGMQLGSVEKEGRGEPTIEDAVRFFERHWAYFETNDAQIEHPTPIQGNWKVDAIGLPPEVLRKLYHDNAEALLFTPLRPLAERLAR